jgi:ribonuclease P protein component
MKTLKNKIIIDELFKNGKTILSDVIMVKILESESNSSFLFAVSSKKFKRAVDRNYIKRLMKESVRKLTACNKNIAFIYIGNSIPSFADIDKSISKITDKI